MAGLAPAMLRFGGDRSFQVRYTLLVIAWLDPAERDGVMLNAIML
jgi:hypothetical protein